MWTTIALLPLAYALGVFPSALIVARAKGHDILREGSGNPGASNVIRVLGWKAGGLVLAMDFSKGAAAAAIGLAAWGRGGAFALGVAAVFGHTFPLGRKGGKGVAATGGMLAVLYPLICVAMAVTWFAVSRLSHKASPASLVVTVAVPVLVWVMGYGLIEVCVIGALSVLLLARHAGNIRRLIHSEEVDLTSRPHDGRAGPD